LGNFKKDFLVLDLPYLFKDVTHARTVLDSEIGQQLLDSLNDIGIVGAAFWENGFRNVTNSKRAINSLKDMKGLKLRTMENEVHMAAFKAFGVDPTPMAWSEVFTSLQTGALDGQENPIAIIHAQQLNTVQDYLAITNHVYSPSALLISQITMDKLDADTKEVLIEAAKEAGAYERELLSSMETQQLAELEEAGMTITRPDLSEFIAAAQTIYADYEDRFTEGLIDEILAIAK
jgi:tripartite ATP-independent transporter DctP family solute receptor